jgi:NADH-quinone oxidoreductase subunit M
MDPTVTNFPWLLAMVAVPAVGAAIVAALPRGRDLLAK